MPNWNSNATSLSCHSHNHVTTALASLSWADADDLIDRCIRSDAIDDGERECLSDIRGFNPLSADEMHRLRKIAGKVLS